MHEALERDLPLASPHLTREQYAEALKGFYCFYRYFEGEVMPRLPAEWTTLFANRQKKTALEHDLHFFGIPLTSLSSCPDLPRYANVPEILGALYVLEGSTLGGQLISRHVQTLFALQGSAGCEYFSSYGSQVGAYWKTFRQLLTRYSSPDWDNEIVLGAQETFMALRNCLAGALG